MLIINPKRINDSFEIKPFWYNYYAGFSHTFTQGIIDSSNLKKKAIILDPWNGAGTTTLMASIRGHMSIGIDLNPVMKIIAMAKQATIDDAKLVEDTLKNIKAKVKIKIDGEDPLSAWFNFNSVEIIRKIESYIVDNNSYTSTNSKVDSLNNSQCVMYTALFNCVREYLKTFIPSNPTWIKKPKKKSDKITLTWKGFKKRYIELLREMIEGLRLADHTWPSKLSKLLIGNSSLIKLEDCVVDLVLTSPPYCTRIDYGVATLPELSIISIEGQREIDLIRRGLMGTTTVPKTIGPPSENLDIECLDFLKLVKNHDSKASKTYYYKNFLQYFNTMKASIKEINRVLKKEAKFVCVVQDSYYKNIHCNLPKIITDMAFCSGLNLMDKIEFESKQNMANLNQKSKQYRYKNTALETVLIFKKG